MLARIRRLARSRELYSLARTFDHLDGDDGEDHDDQLELNEGDEAVLGYDTRDVDSRNAREPSSSVPLTSVPPRSLLSLRSSRSASDVTFSAASPPSSAGRPTAGCKCCSTPGSTSSETKTPSGSSGYATPQSSSKPSGSLALSKSASLPDLSAGSYCGICGSSDKESTTKGVNGSPAGSSSKNNGNSSNGDAEKVMTNFRELLFFWQEYYLRRGRDRLSIEFSSHIPFQHWGSLVDMLCADNGTATSLLSHPIRLPRSPYLHMARNHNSANADFLQYRV